MIIRTEAIVCRSMEYGETSQIVTLFTREKGKIAVIAKGARLPTSRFGSSLQPMSYTQVVFYYKPTRSLQTLTESAHVEPFHGIGRSLERMTIGQRMVELAYALLQEEETNERAFHLLVTVLRRLDDAERHLENLLPFFQLHFAGVLGFAPSVEKESVQHLPDEGGYLALDTGAVHLQEAATASSRRASRSALRAYAVLVRADLDTVMRMELDARTRREVYTLVEEYLRFHVQEAYPARSEHILSQLVDVPTLLKKPRHP